MFLSIAFLFSFPLVFGQFVNQEKELINETKKEIKEQSGDIQAEKKALRHLEGNDVRTMSKNHFYSDFGNLPDVQWERVDSYDIATFMKDGKEMKAYYDFESHLVGTSNKVTFADLPQDAQNEIKKEYADYDIGPVVYFDNNDSNKTSGDLVLLYGIQFESRNNYLVELTKGTKKIVLQVLDSGKVFFYENVR